MSTHNQIVRESRVRSISLYAILALFALTACQAPDTTTSNLQNSCEKPFDKTIYPSRIEEHRHLYFDMTQLASIFLDPKIHIDSIYIDVKAKGRHRESDDELSIDLNGIQTSGIAGSKHYENRDYDDRNDHSHCGFRAEKMKLHGSESFASAIQRIIKNHGLFKLSVHGKRDVHVADSSIHIVGTTHAACTTPTPTATPRPTVAPSATPIITPTPIAAPHTSIQSVSPAGLTISSTMMAINFQSDQSGSNFVCSLDSAAESACSSPVSYSNLANGAHAFKVVAINASGVRDAVGASYSWSIDSIPPSVTITNASALPSATNSTNISFSFTSSESGGSYLCSMDGATAAYCSSPMTYTGLAEGMHQIAIQAIDSLGNVSTTPAAFQWLIDLTPPSAIFANVVPGTANTNSRDSSFVFNANESATFECNLDQAGFSSCASPMNFSALTDGLHIFQIRATDTVGNVGTSSAFSWTIDATAPILTLGQVLPAAGATNSQNISAEFSANELSTFMCSMDGGAFADCASPFSTPILTEGLHELQVLATDQSGNSSAAAVIDWNMDFTLPQLSWGTMLPSAASFINSDNFQADVFSTKQVALSCSVNGVDLGQNHSPIVLSALTEGSYSISTFGTDLVGNVGNTLTHQFTVDFTPPAITLSAAISGIVTQSNLNTFTFSANENASFECSPDHMGFAPCESPMTISGLAEGDHLFEVQATDPAGNVSTISTVQWSIDATAPITTLSAVRSSNTAIAFTFTASEAVQNFECSIDNGVFQTCSSVKSYSGLSVGAHAFQVRAIDLAGNVEVSAATYTWSVDAPVTTTLTSSSAPQFSNQTTATFTFTSNQSTAVFICKLDSDAAMPCVPSQSYSGLAEGAHTFLVQAVDGSGNIDPVGASYNWTVDTTAPVVLTLSLVVGKTSITVNWTTNEPSTSKVNWGAGADTSRVTTENLNMVTSHSVVVTGMSTGSIYSLIAGGSDQAGNPYSSVKRQVRTSQ